MPHTLILGYGNPLRGDDGFGWAAIEGLDLPDSEVLALHQLTPELMEPISRADRVIFLDASTEGTPGEVRERRIEAKPGPASFTHFCTPEGLLAGAQALYGRTAEGFLITVTGADFSVSDQLSLPVRQALHEARAALLRLLAE